MTELFIVSKYIFENQFRLNKNSYMRIKNGLKLKCGPYFFFFSMKMS